MKTHKGTEKRIIVKKTTGRLFRRKRVLGARTKATRTSLNKARRPVELASVHRKVVRQMLPGTKGATRAPRSVKKSV